MVMARIDRKPPVPPPPPKPKLEKKDFEKIGKKLGDAVKKAKMEADVKDIGGALKKAKLELDGKGLGKKIGDIFKGIGDDAKDIGKDIGKGIGGILDKIKDGKITKFPPFKFPEGGIHTLAAGIEQGTGKPGGKPIKLPDVLKPTDPIKLPSEAIEAIKDIGRKIF